MWVGGDVGRYLTFKSENPATQKTDFFGNQDNLTTINTLSEGKITFCSNTDHVQMTGFFFKFKHRKTVCISTSDPGRQNNLRGLSRNG